MINSIYYDLSFLDINKNVFKTFSPVVFTHRDVLWAKDIGIYWTPVMADTEHKVHPIQSLIWSYDTWYGYTHLVDEKTEVQKLQVAVAHMVGNGNSLQCSRLGNPMDWKSAWTGYSLWCCKEWDTTWWLEQQQKLIWKSEAEQEFELRPV